MAIMFVVKTDLGKVITQHKVNEDYGDGAAKAALASQMVIDLVGDGSAAVQWGVHDTSSQPGYVRLDQSPLVFNADGTVEITSALPGLIRLLVKNLDRKTRWLISEGFEHPDALLVNVGGTGYAVDDILIFAGGTSTKAATATVTSVDGLGAVTGIKILERGEYTSFPASPVATSGGTGTGATLDAMTNDKSAVGPIFSMAQNAQTNWTNAMLNKGASEYPIHFPSKDDTYFAQLNDASDVMKYYNKGFTTKKELLSQGALLKGTMSAQTDEASVQAVFDSDARTSPTGKMPPS